MKITRASTASRSWLRKSLIALGFAAITACNPAANTTSASIEESATLASAAALEISTPESVGMNSARLNRITEAMQSYVDEGLLSGVVTMAARDNKIVHFESVGFRDLEAQAPMSNDALFRIYSMTKPITGVALMTLYEEGKFRLADPVEKYLPELKDLQVFAGTDSSGSIVTEPQNHRTTK